MEAHVTEGIAIANSNSVVQKVKKDRFIVYTLFIVIGLVPRQKRGTAFASSGTRVVGKPDNKNSRTAPRIMRGSRRALLLLSALLLKISYVFVPQVWSITLLLPERILSAPAAKIRINSETSKFFDKKISEAPVAGLRLGYARVLTKKKNAALSALSAPIFFQQATGLQDFWGRKIVKEASWR